MWERSRGAMFKIYAHSKNVYPSNLTPSLISLMLRTIRSIRPKVDVEVWTVAAANDVLFNLTYLSHPQHRPTSGSTTLFNVKHWFLGLFGCPQVTVPVSLPSWVFHLFFKSSTGTFRTQAHAQHTESSIFTLVVHLSVVFSACLVTFLALFLV